MSWGTRLRAVALAALGGAALAHAGTGPAAAETAGSRDFARQFGLVAAGDHHTCVLRGAALLCWGRGAQGQLGRGTPETVGGTEGVGARPVALDPGRVPRAVAAGAAHTCVLFGDGGVRCFGAGGSGRLGTGGTATIGDDELPTAVPALNLGPGRTARAIDAGGAHTCAVLDDGGVRCWGLGGSGQLGQGSAADVLSPVAARPVDLGGGRGAVAVATGAAHSCAIRDDGAVVCWGDNRRGQVGIPGQGHVGDDEAASAYGPVDLGAGRTAQAIAAGAQHTCAVLDDGAVRCWGSAGTEGRLGLPGATVVGDGETPGSVDPVAVGGPARGITAGPEHTCVLLASGDVRCWGSGLHHRLGVERFSAVGDDEPPDAVDPVPTSTPPRARALAAGDRHTCAAMVDGTLECWGASPAGVAPESPFPLPVSLDGVLRAGTSDLSVTIAAQAADAAFAEVVPVVVTLRNDGPDPASSVVVRGVRSAGWWGVGNTTTTGENEDTASGNVWRLDIAPGAVERVVMDAFVGLFEALWWAVEVDDTSAEDPDSHPADGVHGQDDRAELTLPRRGAGGPPPPPNGGPVVVEPPVPVVPQGPGPAPAAAARPRGLTLAVSPARDRRAPFRFTASGRLRLPAGTSLRAGCRGEVVVRATAGRREREVARTRAGLELRRGRCTFRARLRLRRLPAGARRVGIAARFTGNAALLGASAGPVVRRVR